jgi:hypothetical protein
MKLLAGTAPVLLLLVLPAAALALAYETFGNAPVTKQPEWAEGVIDVVNLKTRVYAYWVNGNENFFYRGNARALNEALRQYAAVKADAREVILLPGTGKRQSFDRKPIDFDWQFHVPGGLYKARAKKKHAYLTVHINAPRPRPLDGKQVESLLAGLNSGVFKTREKANQELQQLGHDAKPFLRAALKGELPLEARRRVEALLERLPGIDVTDLAIPKGITVLGVDDLLAAGLKDLQDPSVDVRTWAAHELTGLADYSDKVAPALAGMLGGDKEAHARRTAAGCLSHLGAGAKVATAALKRGLHDADAYVRSACQTALDGIASAKDEQPGRAERLKLLATIVGEISDLKRSLVEMK